VLYRRTVRRLVPLLHATLLFAVMPWLPAPFSTPKLTVLCLGAIASLALRKKLGNTSNSWVALLWIALIAIAALHGGARLETLLQLGAAALLLHSLLERSWDVLKAMRSLVWLGCIEAIIIAAQYPLAAKRIDLFGTLGNPDFVAAWIGGSLCLALGEGMLLPAIVQTLALALIGSFASVLALGVACLKLRSKSAAIALAIVCVGTLGRNLESRIEGRKELALQAAPHLSFLGAGPGNAQSYLSQPQDHVHDDWLEIAVEQGIPAALLLLVLAIVSVNIGPKTQAAALASLVARAFVDFPLARPAELALFVTLIAACLSKEASCTASSPQLLPSSSPQPQAPPGAIA
jgi:hypothetical protein